LGEVATCFRNAINLSKQVNTERCRLWVISFYVSRGSVACLFSRENLGVCVGVHYCPAYCANAGEDGNHDYERLEFFMRQHFSPTAYDAEYVYSTMLWNRLFYFKYSSVLLCFSTAIFDGVGKIESAEHSGVRCKLSGNCAL
jgi:hypothetical protein